MGERVAASRSPSRMGVTYDPPYDRSDSTTHVRSHSLPESHSTDVPLDTRTDLVPVKEHGEAANRDTARLEARIFELENRLRETEEELEFYFNFFKKTRRAGNTASGGKEVASGSSGRLRRPHGNGAEQETGLRGRLGEESMASRWSFGAKDLVSDTDSDLEDDEAPVNVNYTVRDGVALALDCSPVERQHGDDAVELLYDEVAEARGKTERLCPCPHMVVGSIKYARNT